VDFSWRVQRRLNGRWRRLQTERGKGVGVTVIAVARELAGGGGSGKPPRPAGDGRGRAGLGDRALAAPLAGRALRRDQAEVGRERLPGTEAPPVGDLGTEPERREGDDPAQTAQPGARATGGAYTAADPPGAVRCPSNVL
jgi:hypothetical protein